MLCTGLLLAASVTRGDVPPEQLPEVRHLLQFVAASDCIIERNGSTHTGQDAIAHIQKKYDYFRDKIRTTEDFIELSASRSTMSGHPYTVRCDSRKPQTTGDWLRQELRQYRQRKPHTG